MLEHNGRKITLDNITLEDIEEIFDFDKDVTIAMIRIWNYNKSRIHSYRGARYIEISLDRRLIFKGEIQRAPGATLGPEACSECVLFTMDF